MDAAVAMEARQGVGHLRGELERLDHGEASPRDFALAVDVWLVGPGFHGNLAKAVAYFGQGIAQGFVAPKARPRASPTAKKVVMVWDTQAESFVGNNIYDVENPPAVGSTAKFETYAAEYIGTGL